MIREANKFGVSSVVVVNSSPKIGNIKSSGRRGGGGGNRGSNNNDLQDSTDESESYSDLTPYAKLEEIDLLSSIGRDIGVDLEKYVQPVPDVVQMDGTEVTGVKIDKNLMIKDLPSFINSSEIEFDANKLIERDQIASNDTRKKEKINRNQNSRRRQQSHSNQTQRRPDKRRADSEVPGTGK